MTKTADTLPVTVVVPVRNEELNLPRCLAALDRFEAVVVLDSHSTDRTVEIAESQGARVVQFDWSGGYPKKRNWLLLNDPPKTPWVLFLDADEIVDDAFCDALAEGIASGVHAGFWLHYRNWFLGQELRHGVQQRKLACFRVGAGLYEKIEEQSWSQLDMEIHEHPIVEGSVGSIEAPIQHYDYKGLGHFIQKHRDYALWEAHRYLAVTGDAETPQHFTPRQKFKYRHLEKWWYPAFYFLVSYLAKQGFRDGAAGFHHAAYKAWYFRTIRLLIKEIRAAA